MYKIWFWEARNCISPVMKTFPLFALFLLGLASVGTAEFWDLGNIEIFRSNIPVGTAVF